jgi:hypothetical protein
LIIFKKFIKVIKFIEPEAVIWLTGLLVLAFMKIDNTTHFTICPLKNIGINFCPGCGLGKAIHYLFHLDFKNSFYSHPLGIFAVIILTARIFTLMKKSIIQIKNQQTNSV